MTEPSAPEARDDAANPPASPPTPRRPDLTTFTIEGRQAPALFVVGWLATLVGGGLAGLTLAGISGPVGAILWLVGLFLLGVGVVLLGGSQAVERLAAGAAYAGPAPILVFIAVLAGSQLAGFVVGLPLSAVAGSIPRFVGDLLGVIVQAVVFIGVVRLMVVGPGALGWAEMGLRDRLADAGRAVLGGAAFAGPVVLATSVVAYAVVQVAGVTPASPLPPTGTTFGLLVNLLAGAVIAPVAEEILFRGFALTAWRRSAGPRRAIIWSSIAFVLAHVLFVGGDTFGRAASLAFVAGAVRVPIALTLGWLYVRTGSLWGPIGLHAAFNAILIVLGEVAATG